MNEDELREVHWWALLSAFKIDSSEAVLTEGQYLLNDADGDTQRESRVKFMMAKSYQVLNDSVNALSYYRAVVNSSQEEISAESLFRISELLYEQDKFDSSETVIFELAQHVPTYPIWLAQGLILLSDIHIISEDYFQAKATLESIITNYKGDENILNAANKKARSIK